MSASTFPLPCDVTIAEQVHIADLYSVVWIAIAKGLDLILRQRPRLFRYREAGDRPNRYKRCLSISFIYHVLVLSLRPDAKST